MTKHLDKTNVESSRLKNTFLYDMTEMSRKECEKKQNVCVNFLKKSKMEHFVNLDVNATWDSKTFW